MSATRPHVQWCITTTSRSVIRCEIAPHPSGACELRVYFGDEVTIEDLFGTEEAAVLYATALYDRLQPLRTDIEERTSRAG